MPTGDIWQGALSPLGIVTAGGLSHPGSGRVRGPRSRHARQGQQRTVGQTDSWGDDTHPDGLRQVLMKQGILAPSLRSSAVT